MHKRYVTLIHKRENNHRNVIYCTKCYIKLGHSSYREGQMQCMFLSLREIRSLIME